MVVLLQIKVLRALQYFGPPDGPQANKALHDLLQTLFNGKQAVVLCVVTVLPYLYCI